MNGTSAIFDFVTMAERMRPGGKLEENRRKKWGLTYDALRKEFANLPESVVLEVLESADGVS